MPRRLNPKDFKWRPCDGECGGKVTPHYPNGGRCQPCQARRDARRGRRRYPKPRITTQQIRKRWRDGEEWARQQWLAIVPWLGRWHVKNPGHESWYPTGPMIVGREAVPEGWDLDAYMRAAATAYLREGFTSPLVARQPVYRAGKMFRATARARPKSPPPSA